ncbi:MAG: hypothetical protein ACXU89_26970 [Xanthobacteraceae bacterium]
MVDLTEVGQLLSHRAICQRLLCLLASRARRTSIKQQLINLDSHSIAAWIQLHAIAVEGPSLSADKAFVVCGRLLLGDA